MTDWYVATTGASGNLGTIGSPWDFTSMMTGKGGLIVAGDTVWARGGTYVGDFSWTGGNGSLGNPITIRNYPGERARIDGSITRTDNRNYIDLRGSHKGGGQGFEVFRTDPAAGGVVNGIQTRGVGCRTINVVSHDASGTGITAFDTTANVSAPEQEVYGCLSYNNGRTNNNDHGIYTTSNGGHKYFRNNVIFNNWALGLQAQGTGPNQATIGIITERNILFNNGRLSTNGGYDILYARANNDDVHDAEVNFNRIYRSDRKMAANLGWYFSSGGFSTNLNCTDNWIVGGLEIDDWQGGYLNVLRNRIYADLTASVYSQGVALNRGVLTNHVWGNNDFYCTAAILGFGNKATAGQGATTQYNFANWVSTIIAAGVTGGVGSRIADTPSGIWASIEQNIYEPTIYHVTIFNHAGGDTAAIDLGPYIQPGDSFSAINVQDYFGSPVIPNTLYGGGLVPFPMTGINPPTPLGARVGAASPPVTGPGFHAFLVQKTGSAPISGPATSYPRRRFVIDRPLNWTKKGKKGKGK